MRKVVILGTGGAASEVTFYIEDHNTKVDQQNQITIVGYLDQNDDLWKKYDYSAPWLGSIESYEPDSEVEILIAIGNVSVRRKMINILLEKGLTIGSFIHESVIMPKNLNIGVGNIVFPFCILEKHANIGNYNFITSYSFISHDCELGDNNFFSAAGIAGSVKVGNDNYFGIKSVVIPGKTIGNNNTVQAGMVVEKNVKDDTTIFYRYKEQVLAIPKVN